MNRVLICFKMAALAAVVFLCVQFGLLLHHANQTLTKLDPVIADLDSVVKRADLLEKNAQYLVLNLGVTANQVRIQSIKEGKALDLMTAQVQATLGHLDAFVVTGQQTEFALQQAVTLTSMNTQPVLAEAHNSLAQLTTSLQSLNVVISNPDIPKTLAAVQKTSEQTAATMGNINKTSSDVKDAVHSYLHPSWPHRVFSWSLAVVHALNPL